MMGRIKTITRFGLFVTFSSTDLSEKELSLLPDIVDKSEVTGLLRWSDLPHGEKYQRNDTLNVSVKTIQADGKLDLVLKSESFRDKYEEILTRTAETLHRLEQVNQGGRIDDDKKRSIK